MDVGVLQLGILLGLGAAAPIGPVNVEIARRTLCGGFWPGFGLGCGAVSVDVLYAILSSQGLQRVLERRAVFWVLAVGGIAILLYLAGVCFGAAWRAMRADPIDATPPPHALSSDGATAGEPNGEIPEGKRSTGRGSYAAGVLMTLFNPATLAFWFLAVPGTLGPITRDTRAQLPMICAGVFVGTFGWVVAFTGILAFAGRYRKRWWLAAADFAGGVTLLAFALASLWRLTRPFL